ncbi:protein-glutamate O-methyltransferase CheR [Rhodobacteraceae bacterium D3-12]|nr:protein-glutamate O-methyltransferase CheR [Rhodobacteraceae bacterium D3-12]
MSVSARISPDDGLMTEAEFACVSNLLRQFTGIDLKASKRSMSSVRLSRLLKAQGAQDLGAFLARLQSDGAQQERDVFINALTTNVTRFNREAHQFEHLLHSVLPALSQALRRGARVRLWSAGCSSGEEAYDLAFRVLEVCPEAAQLDCRILATDINRYVLRQATLGQYDADVVRDIPPAYLHRHFRSPDFRSPGGAGKSATMPARKRVHGAARKLVVFRHLNLQAEWPFAGPFDVIMCRNVTIYFDAATQLRLWHRFDARLQPGGMLYVGHSETMHPDIARSYRVEGPSIFRKTPSPACIEPTGCAQAGVALSPQTRHDHEY